MDDLDAPYAKLVLGQLDSIEDTMLANRESLERRLDQTHEAMSQRVDAHETRLQRVEHWIDTKQLAADLRLARGQRLVGLLAVLPNWASFATVGGGAVILGYLGAHL